MGLKIGWDPNDVLGQLRRAESELMSPYNDGWTQWMHKQNLYNIKFYLDDLLANSPEFFDEVSWLNDREKDKTWKLLNK